MTERCHRVIFLDIDGVLNNEKFFFSRTTEEGNRRSDSIDPECVMNLRTLIYVTRAKLVISSAWRHGDDWLEKLTDVFARAGWEDPPIIGRTPSLAGIRGEEIQAWLDENPTVSYVILDDEDDMLEEQMPYLIQCDGKIGLTEAKAMEALEIWPD